MQQWQYLGKLPCLQIIFCSSDQRAPPHSTTPTVLTVGTSRTEGAEPTAEPKNCRWRFRDAGSPASCFGERPPGTTAAERRILGYGPPAAVLTEGRPTAQRIMEERRLWRGTVGRPPPNALIAVRSECCRSRASARSRSIDPQPSCSHSHWPTVPLQTNFN